MFWLWVNLRDWQGSSGILSLSSSLDALAADMVKHIVAIKKLIMLILFFCLGLRDNFCVPPLDIIFLGFLFDMTLFTWVVTLPSKNCQQHQYC